MEALFKNLGIDINAPEEFDAIKDNPVECFNYLLDFSSGFTLTDEVWENKDEINKGLGAWDYFADTVGIDLDEIHRRWTEIPHTFIPKHVSDHHGLTEIGSLNDQLREAHRAYVFGSDGAAIALCRALMELVLTRHYGVEGEDLEQVISLAEFKFHFLKRLKLQKQRQFANKVLHHRSSLEKLTGEQVQKFLETIKELIEKAPKSDH